MTVGTRIWLVITWIGIGLEGIWFCLVPLAMTGTIGAKDLPAIFMVFLLFVFWIGLVYGAISFERIPALLPFTALANLIGCVALKNIPWRGTRSDWLQLAYHHSIEVVILISSCVAFQQRRRQQIELQHGMRLP
jgi:hypothetical protein